jgi:hypothetical protein
MRVPKRIAIDDPIFGGPKTLDRSYGDKGWVVYGGFSGTPDKLTPLPVFHQGKAAIVNVHITVEPSGDATTFQFSSPNPADLMRAKEFHVTFEFGGTKASARFIYTEKPGTATLLDQTDGPSRM